MRGGKDVLVYCASEYQLELTAYALSIRPEFIITAAKNIRELREAVKRAAARRLLGCIVVLRTKNEPEMEALKLLHTWMPADLPVLEVVDSSTTPLISTALPIGANAPMCDLVDRIRILCKRKRGPKKVFGKQLVEAA